MTFVFGDPVTLPLAEGERHGVVLSHAPRCGYLAVWNGTTYRLWRVTQMRPWRCARCQGSRAWWTFRHLPTCSYCSPMPAEVVENLWEEARPFIETLLKGTEDRTERACFISMFDQAVLCGDTNALLRLILGQRWMRHELERLERGES